MRTFFVAELSGNHNKCKARAEKLIYAAADSGADAVKLQTFKPSCLTLPGAHRINEPSSAWHGRELFELYEEACMPWEWQEDLYKLANRLGLKCFSSPFSIDGVNFLESIGNSIYKIASMEINHFPLLKAIAETKKPVILSTGGASVVEIAEAVQILRINGCTELTLLKCTSAYPAEPIEINLQTMKHMSDLFECGVGLSDHTMGIGVAIAAVVHGAVCIEKHLTLRRDDGGVDSEFSMEPEEFKMMVTESRRAQQALGKIFYGLEEKETLVSAGKRSIYAAKDIAIGEVFNDDNIRIVRPGYGLHPKHFSELIGKKSNRNIKYSSPLLASDVHEFS